MILLSVAISGCVTNQAFNCAGIRTIYMKQSTAQYLAKNDRTVLEGLIGNNEACPNSPGPK
jgi:hypothetical protein